MAAKKEKKAKEKKEKKDKKAASKRQKDESAESTDAEAEEEEGSTATPIASAGAADADDAGQTASGDEGDEGDDTEEGASSGQCKHAAKCIKASSVRSHLKALPKMIEQRRMTASAAGKGSKGKSKDKEAADQPTLWLCMCGALDVPTSHFDKKHAVGLELLSQSWRCFPCQLELREGCVAPKAVTKLRLVTQQVETAIGGAAKKSSASSSSSGSSYGSREASEAGSAAQHQAGSSSSGVSASALHPGVVAKGLRNLGNTCFFNSVMQCIAASTPLYGALLYPSSRFYNDSAISHGAHAALQNALLHFLEAMQAAPKAAAPPPPSPSSAGKKQRYLAAPKDESRVVVPSSLLSAVQQLNPMFRGSRQHDSHELLRTLLNGICVEKEEEVRRKRQAVAAGVVRSWSAEQVRRWAGSFGLAQQDVLETNLLADSEHPWDGAFILWLIENWAAKGAKKPRLALHAGITSVEDKRVIARQFQRIKDGILPDSSVWAQGRRGSNSSSEDEANGDDNGAVVPLHPFESLLQSNFIHSLFGGVARNTVQCLACNTVSTTHEFLLDLSLAIEAPRISMRSAPAPTSSSAAASASPDKKKAAGASSGAIAKHKNNKHASKQSKKHAKRLQRRAGGKKSSSNSAAATEDETSDAEAAEGGGGDDEKMADAPKQEEKADGATDDNNKTDEPAKAAVDSEAAPAESGAASSIAEAPAADSAKTTPAPTDAPVVSSADAALAAVTASGSDAVANLSDEVATLGISDAAPAADATDAAPAASSSSSSSTAAASADSVDAAASSAATTAAAASSPAASSSIVDATAAFISYLRANHLGFERLHVGRERNVSILDCLAAYTDPDLLTGSNRYGCKECSRRAQLARAPSPSPAAPASTALQQPDASAAAADAPSAASVLVADAASTATSSGAPTAADSSAGDVAASSADAEAVPAAASEDSSASTSAPANGASDSNADAPESKEDGDAAPDASAAPAADAAAVEDSMESAEPPPPPPAPLIKQDAIKRSQILTAPTILTLHLKRFHQSGRSIEKSSKSVDVPLCFNLAPYMTAPVASDSVQAFDPRAPLQSAVQVEGCWYHLYGIVSHGGGMGGGHYVSYMRKQNVSEACARDGEACAHSDSPCRLDAADLTTGWHYASDADCRPINVSDVLRAQAYIAFYCKV